MTERAYTKIKAAVIALLNHPDNQPMGFLKDKFIQLIECESQEIYVTFEVEDGILSAVITATVYDDEPSDMHDSDPAGACLDMLFTMVTSHAAYRVYREVVKEVANELIVLSHGKRNRTLLQCIEETDFEVDMFTFSSFGTVWTPNAEQWLVEDLLPIHPLSNSHPKAANDD